MTRRSSRGLRLVMRPERVEALLWATLRFDNRQESREPLFHLYRPYARAIASRHRRTGRDPAIVQDAEQWAYEGLLQAIDSYDPLRGAPFPGFARRRIVGSIRDGFARSTELEAQITARRRLESERTRSLRTDDGHGGEGDAIQRLADVAVGLAIGLMLEGIPLVADGEQPDPAPNAYDTLAWRQTQSRLSRAVASLPAREASIIINHYEHGLTFAHIANLLGLSRGRVSQLHRSALHKLHGKIGKEHLT